MKYELLPLPDPKDNLKAFKTAVRLNSFGSLFFLTYYVLKKNRLATLHKMMCESVEAEDLHLVFEIPMGHFKTTIGSIGLPIWWGLPFNDMDELQMRALGYDDEFIRYMYAVHNPNTRTLITHEIEQRAMDMGKEVDHAYYDNDLFRFAFSEIIPDASCTWNDHSKFHRRDRSKPQDATTGTYEYRGVGQALQGIHPDSTIQDDNFGRAAQNSMLRGDGRVVEDLIRWHQQLSTRLDSTDAGHLGRQLVTGNRWGHADLNSWIRANQPHFIFETHSAEGGCCELHKQGTPIFPEEWPMERLAQKRKDLSPYDFAHFYLNVSVLPEECIFREEWLRYFKFKQSRPDLELEDIRNILLLDHELKEGEEIEDLQPGGLTLRMIVDLAHAKKTKRCDHCIIVVGYDNENSRLYLLDVWAESTGYGNLVDMIYKTARRWRLYEFWLETVAAQNILKFHIQERNSKEKHPLTVNELPLDISENAKKNRIEALEPLGRNGQIWCHRNQVKFINQWSSYPAGLVDILDTLGYAMKIIDVGYSRAEMAEFLRSQESSFANRGGGATGYGG